MFKWILCFIFVCAVLQADPWGKDADLPYIKLKCSPACPAQIDTPFMGKAAEVLISFHQNVISPADGPRSHYLPSSSQYTLNAMRKYGFFKGFLMGCDRLMRENSDPWIYEKVQNDAGKTLKWDPVR